MSEPALPELPPIDTKDSIGYEHIRYVPGYPASYVREYAKAYGEQCAREAAARFNWLLDHTNISEMAVVREWYPLLDIADPAQQKAALIAAIDAELRARKDGPNET